jgi:hypothetical protein
MGEHGGDGNPNFLLGSEKKTLTLSSIFSGEDLRSLNLPNYLKCVLCLLFAWRTDRRETAAQGRKQTRVLWRWEKQEETGSG